MDYLEGLSLKTSTYNCAPQVFIKKHGSKPKPHNVVDMEDADSLLAQGSLICYSKYEKTLQSAPRTALFIFNEGGQKQVNGKEKANKRGMSSPSDGKIVWNLKKLKNNEDLLNQFFESIVTNTTTDQNNDIDSEKGFVVEESIDSSCLAVSEITSLHLNLPFPPFRLSNTIVLLRVSFVLQLMYVL